MKKYIGSLVLKAMGWKIQLDGETSNLNRCILVVAPHTSNWDYLLGVATYWKLGKRLKVIIKSSHTNSLYGWLIHQIGAIGIDRSQKNNLIKIVSDLFQKEDFSLVITPEGSRARAEKWRLGFYHMAMEANVPIVLASGDYKEKIITIGHMIPIEKIKNQPLEETLAEIEHHFQNIHPKYPNQYNPKIY